MECGANGDAFGGPLKLKTSALANWVSLYRPCSAAHAKENKAPVLRVEAAGARRAGIYAKMRTRKASEAFLSLLVRVVALLSDTSP